MEHIERFKYQLNFEPRHENYIKYKYMYKKELIKAFNVKWQWNYSFHRTWMINPFIEIKNEKKRP